jgi:hypothetical protein
VTDDTAGCEHPHWSCTQSDGYLCWLVAAALLTHHLAHAGLQLKKSADQNGGWSAPSVRAQLAMLARQWPAAEALLLAQGKADEAIDMYKQMHR